MRAPTPAWYAVALAASLICTVGGGAAPPAVASSAAPGGTARRSLLAVAATSPWTLRELAGLHLDLVSYDPDTGTAYLTATPAEVQRLLGYGFAVSTVEPDLDAGLRALQRQADLGLYHTYEETVAELESLQARHPDIAHLEILGQSLEGREILALKISDDVLQNDAGEVDVLVVGCHHAREFMTVEVPLHLARTLVEGYGVSPRITILVDSRELWIVPMLNPDGHVFNEIEQRRPGWRKNRRANFDGTMGVDLNRNYSFNWGYDDNGSSSNSASEDYRGTDPFSEPETQAMRALVQRHRFTVALSYHSYGGLLLYPWGYIPALTDDQPVYAALADSMVRSNHYRPGNAYFGTIYLTNGDFDDYMYGELSLQKPQSTISFTVELNSQRQGGFWPPDSLVAPTCEAMLPMNLFLMQVADSVRAPMPPPPPVLAAAQDAADGRRIHLHWTQPIDGENPVSHYEVFEIQPAAAALSQALPVRLAASGRAVLALDLARPASGELALRFDAELEPLWDRVFVEARVLGGAWRALAGEATRTTWPGGRDASPAVSAPIRRRVLRFDLRPLRGDRFDVALRLDADPRSPRRPWVCAKLDMAQSFAETRRVLDPDVRGTSYEVLADRPGLFGYGVTAVDIHGQKSDSEILFFVIPTVEVQVSDVRLQQEGRRVLLRWRGAEGRSARFEAWMRPRAPSDEAADAQREWATGSYVRAAGPLETLGEGVLDWEAAPGSWNVLLRGEDGDGASLWGPWSIDVHAATRLRPARPNPFNPSTQLDFEVSRSGPARLEILAVDGRLVRVLVARVLVPGEHHSGWDGRDATGRQVASGVYVARLRAGSEEQTQRLVLLR